MLESSAQQRNLVLGHRFHFRPSTLGLPAPTSQRWSCLALFTVEITSHHQLHHFPPLRGYRVVPTPRSVPRSVARLHPPPPAPPPHPGTSRQPGTSCNNTGSRVGHVLGSSPQPASHGQKGLRRCSHCPIGPGRPLKDKCPDNCSV